MAHVTLSRDPEDRGVANRVFRVRGRDAAGDLVVLIDDDEYGAMVDTMNLEGPDPENEEGALAELEKLASAETAKDTEHGRVIDLRPNFG